MNDIQLTYSPSRIVEGIANIEIPPDVLRKSNIKNIIPDINQSQTDVKNSVDKLERLRQEQKDGNFIGNWWNDRDDHVKDAQIELNKSIGKLSEKTSTLLIVNTAMAKQLHDQQNILLKQQELLDQQTKELKLQNYKISEQQKALKDQQEEINKANKGLMEAKGLTQEQAKKLVGCVSRVTEAEDRIDAANHALRADVKQNLQDSVEQYIERLDNSFTEQAKLVQEAENRIDIANHALRADVKKDLHNSIEQYVERLENNFAEQAKRHNFFEQQVTNNFSVQEQQIKKSLEQVVSEGVLQKTAVQEQLAATIATLKQQGQTLEHQLNNSLSIQLQNIKSELLIFSNEASEFKNIIEEKLYVHQQKTIEQISAHDATTKQLYDTLRELEAIQNQQAQIQKANEAQLATLQGNYKKNAVGNRLAIAATAVLAIFSLSWQVGQYFF